MTKSQHFLVIGAGRSGIAASKLLRKHGHWVTLYDDNHKEKLRYLKDAELVEDEHLRFAFGEKPPLKTIETVVLSPGVSHAHELITWANNTGIPILSEIDLAVLLMPPIKIIGITGTNGKSTTTVMVEHILKCAGHRALACGNLGRALSDVALHDAHHHEYLVLELSSFQLESSTHLSLDGAIILNITPDHLDRHASFAEYVAAKSKIKDLLKPGAPFVINDNLTNIFARDARMKCFSAATYGRDAYAFLAALPIKGSHNHENAMAATTLAQSLGIANDVIFNALLTFKALPHRCEIVLVKNGITFINDSKGTTVEAVKRALSTYTEPTHLILGGITKGEDFALLSSEHFPHIKGYYVYGRDQSKIMSDLKSQLATAHSDLEHAMRAASARACAGDIIMLSPGCASYDQFDDYQHRGESFRRLARDL